MNTPSERRFDLDWMRVLAILTVFFFHSLRFFNVEDWHVKNPIGYPALDNLLEFMGFWMMPFIFVVSGASLYYALGKGSQLKAAGKFIKDKVLRLLVPLLVNVFSLTILQVYLERISKGQFTGSFFDFLPHYFEGIYGFGGNFSPVGNHLWYLAVLFIFCLVLLPVFMFLKSRVGARGLSWFTRVVSFPGVVYVLVLLIVVAWKLIDDDGILGFDKFNWNLGVYMTYMIFGFVLISSETLQRSLQRLRWVSLLLAAGMTVWYISTDEHTDLVSWSYILTFLGFGLRYLNHNHPTLKYTSEAVLPFYILSQTVQLSVGYFIVSLPMADPLKWAIIAIISLAVIMGIYEFLVRRMNLLRILFGMKPVHKAAQTRVSPGPPGCPGAIGALQMTTPSAHRRLRLFIVDDMPDVRRDLGLLLTLSGDLEIAGEASNGQLAVQAFADLKPDVVLMDLEMPVMDGYAAARQIKARWPETRVVALSVHSYPTARQKASQSGCDDFIEKGAPLQEILRKIGFA